MTLTASDSLPLESESDSNSNLEVTWNHQAVVPCWTWTIPRRWTERSAGRV